MNHQSLLGAPIIPMQRLKVKHNLTLTWFSHLCGVRRLLRFYAYHPFPPVGVCCAEKFQSYETMKHHTISPGVYSASTLGSCLLPLWSADVVLQDYEPSTLGQFVYSLYNKLFRGHTASACNVVQCSLRNSIDGE